MLISFKTKQGIIMKKLFLLLSIVIYSFGSNDIVSPDIAIKPSAEIKQNSIDIKLSLYKHIYVYDKKLKVLITKPKKIDLTNYIAKPATENFKGDQVIVKDFSLNVPFTLIKEKIGNVPFSLEIQYQGCTNLGLCYAPTSKTFKFPKIDNIK